MSDHAAANQFDQRGVNVEKRAGVDVKITKAQLICGRKHLIQHEIAVTQVMVERQGHAVPEAGQLQSLLDVLQYLIHISAPPQSLWRWREFAPPS